MAQVFAEDVNYFQSSTTAADTWIDKAKQEIRSIGGQVLGDVSGTDESGRTVFRLDFKIGPDTFKVLWPTLPCNKKGHEKAAKIQAATMLYHDVKHKVVMAKVKGVRTSFLEYLTLPNGQTAADAAGDTDFFLSIMPNLPMLTSGR